MLSEKFWKLEAVVRLILGVFVCVFIGALLASLARQHYGPQFDNSPWHTVASALSFQGVALVFIARFVREHQISWAEAFGFRDHWKRAMLLGLAVVVFYLPFGWALQWLSAELMTHFRFVPDEQQAIQALRTTNGWAQIGAVGIVAIVLAPLAEELLFRGIIYTTIRQFGYPKIALWGTSILFAGIHWNLPTFLPLLLLALALALLYEKTGNLLAPITAHAFFNAINFVAFYLVEELTRTPLPK